MKIGIDARLIGETGVGRYTANLIRELGRLDRRNSYVVFLGKAAYDRFVPVNERWKKVRADVPWHTVTEQLVMPVLFAREHLDVLHVPYYNPPVFYTGRMVVTVHDLTILHHATGKATTLPLPLYYLKHLAYRAVLAVALRKSKQVIAVSETTKQEIIDHFRINPARIAVTYEGVKTVRAAGEPLVSGTYVLYVGNAYPHKNVETLIAACRLLPGTITCVLVGKEDYFYRRLKSLTAGRPNVRFFGPANDTELANLYTHAKAVVFPSRMEGFGLPGLEALAYGTPVIVSDIPIFHEILKNNAAYVDPASAQGFAERIREASEAGVAPDGEKVHARKAYAAKFSWERMARETLAVYESAAR